MERYNVLNQQVFRSKNYSLVPIRFEDKYSIMKWRNEQIYHLRQDKPLTKEVQNQYFNNVVSKLFEQEQPNQILFSYLKDNKCIGYGGLVHINWIDKNAEISFLMDTSIEKDYFEFHWTTYLSLLEIVAFEEMELHKIFTYAFDLRPKLYSSLENRRFKKEAVLNEHSLFDGKFIDVLIHSKFNPYLSLREATKDDLEITFKWANDKSIRAYAYNQNQIDRDTHTKWFLSRLNSNFCKYYLLEENNKKIAGSIRFDIDSDKPSAKINYLIDPKFTGKGYGTYLLERGISKLLNTNPKIDNIYGFVLKENNASIRIFEKLKFETTSQNSKEIKFEKNYNENSK